MGQKSGQIVLGERQWRGQLVLCMPPGSPTVTYIHSACRASPPPLTLHPFHKTHLLTPPHRLHTLFPPPELLPSVPWCQGPAHQPGHQLQLLEARVRGRVVRGQRADVREQRAGQPRRPRACSGVQRRRQEPRQSHGRQCQCQARCRRRQRGTGRRCGWLACRRRAALKACVWRSDWPCSRCRCRARLRGNAGEPYARCASVRPHGGVSGVWAPGRLLQRQHQCSAAGDRAW